MINRSIIIAACLIGISFRQDICPRGQLPGHTQKRIPSVDTLFDSVQPLSITLKGNIRELLNDRQDDSKYHPIILSYKNEDSSLVSLSVNVKTRGHFRRLKTNCYYPPLLIQYTNKETQQSIFPTKAKLKLVMPCKSDEYVVREWLVYKIYNIITPESFKARLVKVTLQNEKDKLYAPEFFGILLEDEDHMAARNHKIGVERKINQEMVNIESFLKLATFEYLIGNTDWSVEYLQNIKLIADDSTSLPVAVPYDFDHAGIVNAPYARPAEELKLFSVRERRYRGYCIQDMKAFDNIISVYNNLKDAIYTLYRNNPLLDAKYIKTTVGYLDEFYKTINNPKSLTMDFKYPCDKNGTGNVIIKGLKRN
ncbi:MAG: hypothetical protein QM764_01640 [Chitinophagaceae bacterium]